jgi:hypothetical protein
MKQCSHEAIAKIATWLHCSDKNLDDEVGVQLSTEMGLTDHAKETFS